MMWTALLIGFLGAQVAAFDVHANAFETQALPGHVPSALSAAEPVGALSRAATSSVEPLALTVVLRRSDPTGFQAYLRDVYDTRSSQYLKFLNPREVSDRFGPSAEDYAAVRAWFERQGFLLTEGSANRMTMIVSGTRVLAEGSLGVNIGDYTLDEQQFFANDRDPQLPREIAGRVQAVVGLSDLARPRPVTEAFYDLWCGSILGELAGGTAISSTVNKPPSKQDRFDACKKAVEECTAETALDANQVKKIIDKHCEKFKTLGATASVAEEAPGVGVVGAPTDWKDLDGTGQTIGITAFDTFDVSDVRDYLELFGLPDSLIDHLSQVHVGGGASLGPDESEVLLDIATVLPSLPGAQVVVYDAPFTGAGSFQALFNQMLGDGVTIISNSWGYCEKQTTRADVESIDAILAAAAASGVGVYNASGDTGSICLDGSPNTIVVPAGSPNASAVGGTTLIVGPDATYQSETWWNGTSDMPPSGQGGFGVSRFFARPGYQDGLNPSSMRSVPDVVFKADPARGVIICQASAGGCPSPQSWGGTSVAAPAVAVGAAVLNQALGMNLGNLNPLIYPLAGSGAFHPPSSMGSDFEHVGLGSPKFNALFLAFSSTTAGPVSATVSDLNTVDRLVPADGSSAATVVVRLYDEAGNTVTGKTVALTANAGSSATITPVSGVADENNGAVIFSVTDSVVEEVTVTANDLSDGIELAQQVTFGFVEPPATAGGIDAFPTIVPANGLTTSTITVTLVNALGDGAQEKEVTLDQGPGRSVVSAPTPALTDVNGEVTFEVTNLFTEAVTYTAIDVTDGNLVIPGSTSVSFTNGAPQFCNIGEPVPEAGFAVSSFATSFPFGIFGFCQGAAGMAFDTAGNLFVVDEADGNLYKFGAAGGIANETTKLTSTPYPLNQCVQGLAFSKDNEHLYMARQGCGIGGDVVEISPTDGAVIRVVAPDILCATGIATDPISGDLFVSSPCPPGSATTGGTDQIHRIADPESATSVVSVYSSPGHAQGLTFTPDGTLWATPLHFDPPLRRDVVRIDGTDSATPGAFSIILSVFDPDPMIAATNVVPSFNPDDPGSPTTLSIANGNGGINHLDLTQSPPAITPVATGGDAVIFMIGGPDGCLYSDDMDRVVRVTAADGSCDYAPSTAAPVLLLAPADVAPNPEQGSEQTMVAQFVNISVPEDTPVFFSILGANDRGRLARTDSTGQAAITYTGVFPGTDSVVATATIGDASFASNTTRVTWDPGPHVTFLSLNTSPGTATVGVPVTFQANLTDVSMDPVAAVPGEEIEFSVDGASCSADTDASGSASCDLTLPVAGTFTLTASFAGSGQLLPASGSQTLFVLDDPAPPPPTTCEPRTDYGPGKCSGGTFRAGSKTDLDAYSASNFGKDGGKRFKDLRITANLEGLDRKIESPCQIKVDAGVELHGGLVGVDGLKRVKFNPNMVIDAATACLLSPYGQVTLGSNAQVTAADVTIEGATDVKVGANSRLNVSGRLVVHSTGIDNPKRSRVVIGPGAGADVTGSGTSVTVGGDMELTAEWEAKIAAKTRLNVSGDLKMDAGVGMKCSVASSAAVTFGSKSGNCASELP